MQLGRVRHPLLVAKWAAAMLLPAVLLSTDQWECGPLMSSSDLQEILHSKGLDFQSQPEWMSSCAAAGKTEDLLWMLLAGADANGRADAQGETPMMAAAGAGQLQAMRLLMGFGATVKDERVLQRAIENHQREAVTFLLKSGASVDVADKLKESPLALAVRLGFNDIAATLLDFGADVNGVFGQEKHTPLYVAARVGNTEAVSLLLGQGASAIMASSTGETPLHMAVSHGDDVMMRALLDAGADVHAAAADGQTPILAAARKKDYRTVHLLRERSEARPSAHGESLQRAVEENNVRLVQQMLQEGADAHTRVGESGTPLLMLASSAEMQDLLLSHGADLYATDHHGNTWVERLAVDPYATAEKMSRVLAFGYDSDVLKRAFEKFLEALPQSRNIAAIKPLLMSGVDWKPSSATMLHRVAHYGSEQEIHELLQLGIDVNLQDEKGTYVSEVVPLAESGKLKLLLERGLSAPAQTAALRRGLTSGDVVWTEMLLSHGTSPHGSERPLYSGLLENAAYIPEHQMIACMRLLVQHGLKIETLSATDQLLFLCASEPSGHDAARMQQLVQSGADINAYAPQGKAPLAMALAAGASREFIIALLLAGANADMGPTTAAEAVAQRDYQLVQLLLKQDKRKARGDTGLLALLAKHCPRNGIIPKLLAANVNVNSAGADGLTPMMFLVEKPECTDLVAMFIKHGAKVNSVYPDGRSLLMAACAVPNNVRMVQELLAAGADVFAWDSEMRSALNHYVCDEATANVIIAHLASKRVPEKVIQWEQQKCNTIRISIRKQQLYLRNAAGAVIFTAPVSTARRGSGNGWLSKRTPVGRFRIASAYGKGMPKNMMFRAGCPIRVLRNYKSVRKAVIMARVLALDGLDNTNRNTLWRNIYLHGTNKVHAIGRPASGGCIRLLPEDIVEMFPLAPPGTRVKIEE